MTRRALIGVMVLLVVLGAIAAGAVSQLPAIGAGALLFPTRNAEIIATPPNCVDRRFDGEGLAIGGWHCESAATARRGTVVYLHGIGDNRSSAIGVIEHWLPRGYDVIAYDSRRHGASDGAQCTYGYFEKADLKRVITQSGAGHVVLMGHSLGGAVALQAAAAEPQVRGVIAIATFSDLRTVVMERAPQVFFPAFAIDWALARAERDGQFVIDDVSPVKAAQRIAAPVLLIHGAEDHNTPPSHSERVFAALRGRRHLVLVPRAGHNDVLRREVWTQIDAWMEEALVD